MTVTFRVNPPERDEDGYLHDYEKTWICFTITVKKAPDAHAAADTLEFIEWHINEVAEIPCALLGCVKRVNGVHTDILTFDRDKDMTKHAQADEIRAVLDDAKAAYFKKTATAMSPFFLAATRKTA